MNWMLSTLDSANAALNTPLLTGAAGLVGVTGSRTLVFAVCGICVYGVVLQVRRAWPRLLALVRGEQVVSIPAHQLVIAVLLFLALMVGAALLFGIQASGTYYAVQGRTLGQRDVVTSLTWATLLFHLLIIGMSLTVSWLAVIVADVVTGEKRERRHAVTVRSVEGRL